MRDDEEVNFEEVRYTAEDLFPDYIEKETPIDDDLKNKVQPQSANPFLNVKPPAVKVGSSGFSVGNPCQELAG